MRGTANLGASVTARLLNKARQSGDEYQTLLTAYCYERFPYRLGASPLRDRFVLKGAMLLRLWSGQPYRATRDLDLLRRGDGSSQAVVEDLRSMVSMPVPPDAVDFDGDAIRVETLRAAEEYAGFRAKLQARCGSARLGSQIDIGLGDSVWPTPTSAAYPTLIDSPAPDVLAYRPEAVVAEKVEALVVLGDRNGRIKDFFDLHDLANRFEFDRATLVEAVHRTFERRNMPIPARAPLGLTLDYWQNPSRPAQVRAFARRARVTVPDDFPDELVRSLGAFLMPVLDDARRKVSRDASGRLEGLGDERAPVQAADAHLAQVVGDGLGDRAGSASTRASSSSAVGRSVS